MAIDTAHHRLFIGCDNKVMAMMDSTTGKVITTVPIGEGVDANAFDPGTQLAFASCGGAGTTTIAHEDSPDKLTVVQTLKTATGARTMTIDPKTHKIYLSVGQRNGPANNFKVLVYEMAKALSCCNSLTATHSIFSGSAFLRTGGRLRSLRAAAGFAGADRRPPWKAAA